MEGRESSRRLGRKWWVFQNREEGITLKCSPLKRHLPTIHNLWSPGNCTYHHHDSSTSEIVICLTYLYRIHLMFLYSLALSPISLCNQTFDLIAVEHCDAVSERR